MWQGGAAAPPRRQAAAAALRHFVRPPDAGAWPGQVVAAQDQDGDGRAGKNRHYRWKKNSARHWLETAKRCGFPEMKAILDEVIARTPKAVEQTSARLPRKFPVQIAATILSGTPTAARLLGEQLAKAR